MTETEEPIRSMSETEEPIRSMSETKILEILDDLLFHYETLGSLGNGALVDLISLFSALIKGTDSRSDLGHDATLRIYLTRLYGLDTLRTPHWVWDYVFDSEQT